MTVLAHEHVVAARVPDALRRRVARRPEPGAAGEPVERPHARRDAQLGRDPRGGEGDLGEGEGVGGPRPQRSQVVPAALGGGDAVADGLRPAPEAAGDRELRAASEGRRRLVGEAQHRGLRGSLVGQLDDDARGLAEGKGLGGRGARGRHPGRREQQVRQRGQREQDQRAGDPQEAVLAHDRGGDGGQQPEDEQREASAGQPNPPPHRTYLRSGMGIAPSADAMMLAGSRRATCASTVGRMRCASTMPASALTSSGMT